MTAKAKRLLSDALKLPDAERADLAARLWNSLDEKEWTEEIEARVDDMKQGRVKGIPLKEALARLGRPRNGTARKR